MRARPILAAAILPLAALPLAAWATLTSSTVNTGGLAVTTDTLTAPGSFTCTSKNTTAVTFTWTAPTKPQNASARAQLHYALQRSTAAAGPYSTVASTTALTASDPSPAAGTTYYLVSASVNGWSAPTANDPVTVTVGVTTAC